MSREESWAISKISSMRGLPFCVSSNPAPQPSGQAASGFNRVHKQGDGTLPAGTSEVTAAMSSAPGVSTHLGPSTGMSMVEHWGKSM